MKEKIKQHDVFKTIMDKSFFLKFLKNRAFYFGS